MKYLKILILFSLILISACESKNSNDKATKAALERDAALQAGALAIKPKTIPPFDTSKKTYRKLDLYNDNVVEQPKDVQITKAE